MTPRPRSTSDQAIIEATARVIGRLGPGRLRLADVAEELGISPATLSQRFGTKRNLLLAVASLGPASVGELYAAARAAHPSPLDALLASCAEATRYFGSPEELSNHLAFLQMDLTDPDFHRLAVTQSDAIRHGMRDLLRDAVEAGELAPCDTDQLSRALQSAYNGALLNWAIHRDGSAEEWVRGDLETLLRPFRSEG